MGAFIILGCGLSLAILLFVLDHLFFSLALALKTYSQKFADSADIAPSAAVAFPINHIAAAMVFASLVLALMIPRHPRSG